MTSTRPTACKRETVVCELLLHFLWVVQGMNLAELLIKLVHVLFIVFFTVTPFLPLSLFPEVHILHLATGPLLFLHWLMNSDECCLTQLECAVTGKAKGESFFHAMVSPMYHQSSDGDVRKIVWVVSVLLWLITCVKVYQQPDVVRRFVDQTKAMFSHRSTSS